MGSQRLKEIIRQKEQARQEAVDRANEMTARVNDALKIVEDMPYHNHIEMEKFGRLKQILAGEQTK